MFIGKEIEDKFVEVDLLEDFKADLKEVILQYLWFFKEPQSFFGYSVKSDRIFDVLVVMQEKCQRKRVYNSFNEGVVFEVKQNCFIPFTHIKFNDYLFVWMNNRFNHI